MSVCKYVRQPARHYPGNSCSSTHMWRTLLRRTFIDTTFETSAQIITAMRGALLPQLWRSGLQAAGSSSQRFWTISVTHSGYAQENNGLLRPVRAHTPARVGVRGLELLPSSHPGQVSVAKVLLGVFGVAVVIVVIAVPTAIFLNSESQIPSKYWLIHEDESVR